MARYYGASADIGVGVGSTWGTAVAIANWLEMRTFELIENAELKTPATLRQSSRFSKTAPVVVKYMCGVKMSTDLQYDFQGPLWRAALGSSSASSGAGPYVHTYVPGYEPAFYTIAGDLGDSGNSRTVDSAMVNTMTITIGAGDLVKVDLDWIGRLMAAPASAGSPTYAATRPVVRSADCVMTWNSLTLTTDEIGSAVVTISNALNQPHGVGSLYGRTPFSGGERMVEIKLDVEYGSTIANAFATAALAVTQSDFVITATSGANILVITVRNAYVVGDSLPKNTTTDPLRMSVTLRGMADADPLIDVVITNASSSNVANA